jgi:hypothetical protein
VGDLGSPGLVAIYHALDAAHLVVAGREAVGHVAHDPVEHLAAHILVGPVQDADPAEELVIKDVGEGTVPEIVAKT